MAKAKDVASVIAGEATSGTPEQRWADMVKIASVIANRARQLGVTPQEVVANSDEFNAYGKDLPPGVDQNIVGMAEQAMDYVQTYGPVNDATFYSTPEAVDGLPSGLQTVDQSPGHVFSVDPQNRAVNTANGYETPSGEQASRLMAPYDTTPQAQFDRLYGQQQLGLLSDSVATPYGTTFDPSLTPGQQAIQGILSQPAAETQPEQATDQYGLLGPVSMAQINATPTGQNRPFAPEQTTVDNIQAAVTSIMGPDAKVQVTSGQEGGLSQFGSNRHKTGLAADITITAPDGHVLSLNNPDDAQTMKDIAQSAATQQANIGLGYTNSPNMMHVDYVPATSLAPGQDQSWGTIGNDPEFAAKLDEARQFSLMPDSYYEAANQRVIENNITPTLNSPLGFNQEMQTEGLLSLTNPVTPTAVERAALPDIAPVEAASLGNFPAGMMAQREVATGINSVDHRAVQAQAEQNLADATAASAASLDSPMRFSQTLAAPTPAVNGWNTMALAGPLNTAIPSATPVAAAKPMPSYADAMAQAPAPAMPVATAMAMETPNFNQALNPTVTGLLGMERISPAPHQVREMQQMAAIPGIDAVPSLQTISVPDTPAVASIDGPANTPAVTQQTTQAVTQAAQPNVSKPASTSQNKGLLSGMISKEAIGGGLLGGIVAGPLGGVIGGLLGRQIAANGGLSSSFSSSPMSISNIGGGLTNTASVWGGAPAGTQATTSDGGSVTSLGGGWTGVTGPSGVTTSFSPWGGGASYHGPSLSGDTDADAEAA